MRIAVLGWGSLIKHPMDLHIVNEEWHLSGPTLSIALSRLSDNRGHLTYVVDEHHQRRVPTRYAISEYGALEDAGAGLAEREGSGADSIGYVTTAEGRP